MQGKWMKWVQNSPQIIIMVTIPTLMKPVLRPDQMHF